MEPRLDIRSNLYPDITSIKHEDFQQTFPTSNAVPPKSRSIRSKHVILPNSFSHDVRPHPVFVPPEENAFGKISHQVANIARIETPNKWLGRSSQGSLKPNPQRRGVKVEEFEDENDLPRGSQFASRSGPRKSEPSSNLEDRIRSMHLNESTPPSTPPTKRNKKPRKSEPTLTSTSFGSDPPNSSFLRDAGTPTGNRLNAAKLKKDVLKLFDEHRSHDYQKFDTTLGYSNYTLKLHQAYARPWMADQESDGRNGGIVADEMGLGKTLQMLVRIKEDTLRTIARRETVRPTLIVGPKSILLQWDEEIRRFFLPNKGLTCIIYHGHNRESKYTLTDLEQTDIVLTTYGVLTIDHQSTEASKWAKLYGLFGVQPWRRIVLDEAHEIRNASTQKAKAAFAVNAEFKWCLTGTPLQNKIRDLFSLFHLLRVENFSDDGWFKSNIELPITKNTQDSLKAQRLLKIALGNTMLRRLKTDEVNGQPILVLPELRITIWDCDLSPSEREFYDALEARMQDILESLISQLERGDIRFYSAAWVLLLRLRQACIHPALLVQNLERAVEDVGAKDKRDVLKEDNRCPLCRNRNESTAHKKACGRYIEMAKYLSKTQPSTKITITLNILREIKARPGNEKTIIFSQFTSMLNLIEPFLQRQNIRFSRRKAFLGRFVDGTMDMNKRKEKLEAIKTDPNVTVILVSLMAGGTGLNLTECNNVILFDLWWNPAVEEQAFARAHRMGQTRTVNVYKLVTKDTVERRIMELQDKKKKLAMETLDRDEIEDMKNLSKDEILRLLACHI
ncbi:SNF2 family N-terminal domain-containing protein [Lentinula aff. lateritia]|uniref:SNF2 family N-terminal domain-containing protein n=1 Tax=Lentinula aff. lateritia TaxID=2804960 RepID=A0ACC1TVY2_9AGAR|nr:SNF2 family N-terminal domain-containing protein [Lentinula aff. lateritia]